jgi:hypothetical protein
MKGIFEKCPCANSFEGKSGITPVGPSILGTHGNCSFARDEATLNAFKISDEDTFLRQSKVFNE